MKNLAKIEEGVNMKRHFLSYCIVLIGIFLIPCSSFALMHISNNNFAWECSGCHIYGGPADGVRPCEDCHNTSSDDSDNYDDFNTIKVATHSSEVIGSVPPYGYGTWGQECLDCHQHHTHKGLSRYDGVTEPSYVLGELTINWPVSDAERTETTFTIDASSILDPAWGDPATWAQKTGNERGLILVMKPNSRYIWWEIIDATETTVTIANVRTYFRYRDKPFEAKLVYGMLIKDEVNGVDVDAGGPSTMADDESGTEFDPTPEGICQVCHTQTLHWRYDGSLADHFSGWNCILCHPHEQGFKVDPLPTLHPCE